MNLLHEQLDAIAKAGWEAGRDTTTWECLRPGERAGFLKLVMAILSTYEANRPGEWRPIETAPKDGTEVLIASKSDVGGEYMYFVAGYHCRKHALSSRHHACPDESDCNMQWISCLATVGGTITHWQPLPAPPGSK